MLSRLTMDAEHIYLALGATDFRKQISTLASLVQLQFGKDPFAETSVFIFCNRKRDSIKVLRYDKNGFILTHKKLIVKMKFQWPKDTEMIKEITGKQIEWLLGGLEIEQKQLIEKQRIQIDNMIQALLHARKKMFGASFERTNIDGYFPDCQKRLKNTLSIRKITVQSVEVS